MIKVGIVDYGTGNIFSLRKAFRHIGVDAVVSKAPDILKGCDGIILPGVGAYGAARTNMSESRLDEVITEQAAEGRLIVGICLGMQLLFEHSVEGGSFKGLGLFTGWVDRLQGAVKVPHVGWNTLHMEKECKALKGIEEGTHVYYVHSYFVREPEAGSLCAVTDHGEVIPAVVCRDNIVGFQFHPEKSGEAGLEILKNIKEMLI